MKLEIAAQKALEALESIRLYDEANWRTVYETITALREALSEQAEVRCPGCDYCNSDLFAGTKCNNCGRVLAEQAEQEPVAWAYIDADGSFMDALDRQHGAYQTPLYAAPVRTKDLTDDEIKEASLLAGLQNHYMGFHSSFLRFARAVIAADREKNK